jgi:hypothetical protein
VSLVSVVVVVLGAGERATFTSREHVLSLLAPYPAGEMRMYEISPRVNRATEDTPELIKAV